MGLAEFHPILQFQIILHRTNITDLMLWYHGVFVIINQKEVEYYVLFQRMAYKCKES